MVSLLTNDNLNEITTNNNENTQTPTCTFVRNIDQGKRCRIISKDDLKKSDLPSTLDICVNIRNWPLTKKCKISNLPNNTEKYLMQTYHFNFSHGDLEKMVTTPKVAFDRYHKNFTSNGELVSKSFFTLAAPQVENMDLPVVYRFSVSRYVDDPQHYSISVHAIVGGREDGWLFLARLDNNTKNEHIVKGDIKAMLKTEEDVIEQIKPCPASNLSEKGRFHVIPYPHIHRADSNCEKGIQPEKLVPIYVEKCKDKSFEQNIQYMMQLFNIQSSTMFCKNDEFLEDVLAKSKKHISTEKTKDATSFVNSIILMEKTHGRNVGDIGSDEIVKHIKNSHNNKHSKTHNNKQKNKQNKKHNYQTR